MQAERIQIPARAVKRGDKLFIGPKGHEIGRAVAAVVVRDDVTGRTFARVSCTDGSTPILDADRTVTVERDGGESR